jgi:hypothetical protein
MTGHGKQARLERENHELREALYEQWEAAHFDHCGRWPHSPQHGPRCNWPPPPILGLMVGSQPPERATVSESDRPR